jgi:hypothetical protein
MMNAAIKCERTNKHLLEEKEHFSFPVFMKNKIKELSRGGYNIKIVK